MIESVCVELELCEVKTCSKIYRKWGGDHLVPVSGLEKEEDNFPIKRTCSGQTVFVQGIPKSPLYNAK